MVGIIIIIIVILLETESIINFEMHDQICTIMYNSTGISLVLK